MSVCEHSINIFLIRKSDILDIKLKKKKCKFLHMISGIGFSKVLRILACYLKYLLLNLNLNYCLSFLTNICSSGTLYSKLLTHTAKLN